MKGAHQIKSERVVYCMEGRGRGPEFDRFLAICVIINPTQNTSVKKEAKFEKVVNYRLQLS